MPDSLRPHGLWPARLPSPWDFPRENTGVGCHFLLQGIFLIQRLNLHLLCLLHYQVDSLSAEPSGSLFIFQWVTENISILFRAWDLNADMLSSLQLASFCVKNCQRVIYSPPQIWLLSEKIVYWKADFSV